MSSKASLSRDVPHAFRNRYGRAPDVNFTQAQLYFYPCLQKCWHQHYPCSDAICGRPVAPHSKSLSKKTNVKALDPRPYPDHITAPELVEQIGINEFKSYFSFAIVRNPWDWQVSLHEFARKTTIHHQHELTNGFDSFNEYIQWRCTENVRLQKDFTYSKDGQLLVDFIGKFETLETDFEKICSRIGITAALPKLNISNTKPWQNYYDEETKELIRQTFEPDIHLFEYDF